MGGGSEREREKVMQGTEAKTRHLSLSLSLSLWPWANTTGITQPQHSHSTDARGTCHFDGVSETLHHVILERPVAVHCHQLLRVRRPTLRLHSMRRGGGQVGEGRGECVCVCVRVALACVSV